MNPMRRFARTIAAAATLLLGPPAAETALAAPLAGAQIQARSAGGEFRGDTFTFRGFESHIWRFAPDGSASAVAVARRTSGGPMSGSTMVEFGDIGRWRVEGDRLCVEWAGPNRQFSGCYGVDAQQGDHVRIVGPARWEGTLGR